MSCHLNKKLLFFAICVLTFFMLLEYPSFAVHKLPKKAFSKMLEALSGHRLGGPKVSGSKSQSKHFSVPPSGNSIYRNLKQRLQFPALDKPESRHLKQRLTFPSNSKSRSGSLLDHSESPLESLYRRSVSAVPLVIGQSARGSSVVVKINEDRTSAWLITSAHILKNPFRNKTGHRRVILIFHHRLFARKRANEMFPTARLNRCRNERGEVPSAWCSAFHSSFRWAKILKTDEERDLAYLEVSDPPKDVRIFTAANVSEVGPGRKIAVIGHGEGMLWSLSSGIISGIRDKYPMGSRAGTVIQHQAPVAPGSSGGPLLTLQGQLLGIIAWKLKNFQGFNGAIAVNEFQSYLNFQ